MAMASIKILCLGRKVFPEVYCRSKEYVVITNLCRRKHSLCFRANESVFQIPSSHGLKSKFTPVAAVASVRWASQGGDGQSAIVIDESTLPPAPAPPALPMADVAPTSLTDSLTDAAIQVATEPDLASYGLVNFTPVGLAQKCLEYLHVTVDLPWWGSIVVGTIVLRTLVFPIVIIAQRNASKMANNLPQLQRLQQKMTEARQSGNNFEAARVSQEMMLFMKEKKLNPIANMLPPLAQAPLFISMFMGLRGMCNVPVDSLRTGGMFWFVDLTVPDQYYLLPIITSLTLAATIELGTDSARASTLGMMKYALRCMPIIIFPFTVNFPGAILCYWASTNFISLIQVGILRIPKVRAYFKIDPIVIHPKDSSANSKGFVKGFKESMSNMKITRELNDRQYVDSINFQKAGRAPLQRTFKYDPTKVAPTSTELLAKKK